MSPMDSRRIKDAARRGLYDPRFEHDACGVGFVAHIKGERSHDIVAKGLQILDNLVHRGASGSDPETGDGAGILLQVPDGLLRRECAKHQIELPVPGAYGVGMVFLPQDDEARRQCEAIAESAIRREGLRFLGWRTVPTDNRLIGRDARASEPVVRQFFVGHGLQTPDDARFDRKLYVVRRVIENEITGETGIPHAAEELHRVAIGAHDYL